MTGNAPVLCVYGGFGQSRFCPKRHGGAQPDLFHYRETHGLEIDLLIEQGRELEAVKIKSGATINEDFFRNLERFQDRFQAAMMTRPIRSNVVYNTKDFKGVAKFGVRSIKPKELLEEIV